MILVLHALFLLLAKLVDGFPLAIRIGSIWKTSFGLSHRCFAEKESIGRIHSSPTTTISPSRECDWPLTVKNGRSGNANDLEFTRRCALKRTWVALGLIGSFGEPANAGVGTLPELEDANLILQGVTIQVADKSQQAAMINFLQDSFDFKVLRQRVKGSVEEIWLGFGPEQLSTPPDFTLPVSSFYEYGGHASIHLVYDSKSTSVFYNIGDAAPGNNIAYLQLGVPTYRISQMVKTGGNILDAYGIVNVISPSGLPIRGIVGIAPDPIMLIAINCPDVKQSREFYEQLGFQQQDYPFSRPGKGTGVFEPPPPKDSVYLAPTANGMGILLLPTTKRKKQVQPNPAVDGLNIVYNSDIVAPPLDSATDPSGVGLRFISVEAFEEEERRTREQITASR